jgi:hypothetical protein
MKDGAVAGVKVVAVVVVAAAVNVVVVVVAAAAVVVVSCGEAMGVAATAPVVVVAPVERHTARRTKYPMLATVVSALQCCGMFDGGNGK